MTLPGRFPVFLTTGLLAALLVTACARDGDAPDRLTPGPVAAPESATPPTAAPAPGPMDEAVLRAARTPISFRHHDEDADAAARTWSIPGSGGDDRAGNDGGTADVPGAATSEGQPSAAVPDLAAARAAEARRSASQMGLILLKKIVLPTTSARRPVERQDAPPPPRRSGDSGKPPAPSPSRFGR